MMNQVMKLRSWMIGIFIVVLSCSIPHAALAQEEAIELHLNRDWGYGGLGEIQGLFTLSATGPDNLAGVSFYIGDQLMAQVTEPPYKIRFSTDDYPLGEHILSATGLTTEGNELASNQITIRFVSAETGWKTVLGMIVPIFVIIAAALLISVVVTFASGKNRLNPPPGTERRYGSSGGAICPKCKRPSPLHWFGLNLAMWKYDRCENCMKWSGMKRLPVDVLRQAEADELAQARRDEAGLLDQALSEEEKLKKEIEDSRFQDLR